MSSEADRAWWLSRRYVLRLRAQSYGPLGGASKASPQRIVEAQNEEADAAGLRVGPEGPNGGGERDAIA